MGCKLDFPLQIVHTHSRKEAKELWLSLQYPVELYYQLENQPNTFRAPPQRVEFNAMSIFQANRMRFKGSDGQYFMPQFWEYFVRPGWTVTLEFRDRIIWSGMERHAEVVDFWMFGEYIKIMKREAEPRN